MKIGVILASSQKEKNKLLFDCTCRASEKYGYQTVNFGCLPEETAAYSYVETAVAASMLLCGGAVDFIVTGCSSGQGMMLACNSLPGILCGYVENPQDAFLFGRINDGNAASLPMGLNFGWAGEINLQATLDKLFDGPFGTGYPPEDAERKRKDTVLLKKLNASAKKEFTEVWKLLDEELRAKTVGRKPVADYILEHGSDAEIKALLWAERKS